MRPGKKVPHLCIYSVRLARRRYWNGSSIKKCPFLTFYIFKFWLRHKKWKKTFEKFCQDLILFHYHRKKNAMLRAEGRLLGLTLSNLATLANHLGHSTGSQTCTCLLSAKLITGLPGWKFETIGSRWVCHCFCLKTGQWRLTETMLAQHSWSFSEPWHFLAFSFLSSTLPPYSPLLSQMSFKTF